MLHRAVKPNLRRLRLNAAKPVHYRLPWRTANVVGCNRWVQINPLVAPLDPPDYMLHLKPAIAAMGLVARRSTDGVNSRPFLLVVVSSLLWLTHSLTSSTPPPRSPSQPTTTTTTIPTLPHTLILPLPYLLPPFTLRLKKATK